jgi:hypothetical protein
VAERVECPVRLDGKPKRLAGAAVADPDAETIVVAVPKECDVETVALAGVEF